jgi:DNA-binding protein H-NS
MLRRLENANSAIGSNRRRRAYRKVLPKYQNPTNTAETWSGRGKQPHWVQAQLRAGKKLEHFLIARSSTEKAPPDWVNSLSHAGSPLTV